MHAGLGLQQYTVSDHNVLFLFTCRVHCGQRGRPEDTEYSDQSLMALDLLVWDNEVGDGALRESRTLTSIELDACHNCITRNRAVALASHAALLQAFKGEGQWCASTGSAARRIPTDVLATESLGQ